MNDMPSDDPSQLVLGVDAGGTKTVAWLASAQDSGAGGIVGRGVAGPGNPRAVGFETALQNLGQAVEQAFEHAEIAAGRVAAACLALAGADRETERRELERWAAERQLAVRLLVVNDALPVLAAGAAHGPGVALIAGTGSFAYGRNSRGETARAGGWGYLLGDEGSGYAIAIAALRAVARSADGRGPATELSNAILQRMNLQRPVDLIAAVYQTPIDRAAIAALAEVVTETAARGDAVAEQIVDRAVDDLAELVSAVAVKLGIADQPLPLSLAGGALLHSEHLQRRLRAGLTARGLQPTPMTLVPEPVSGAVVLARVEAARK